MYIYLEQENKIYTLESSNRKLKTWNQEYQVMW